MVTPILATKLYIPPLRAGAVRRPRLVERLHQGFAGGLGLTVISAPAGFGKTTLVTEWIHQAEKGAGTLQRSRVAWLSLDEGDNDPGRFLTYLVAALRTVEPELGASLLGVLSLPQPPPIEAVLTELINEIDALTQHLVLVLDDYHVIESQAINHGLAYLREHLPPALHLLIATREDPPLPLARWRASGQLAELRAADLRFTPVEAAEFLNRMMGLGLAPADIAALDHRTEGWVAGLQLAALWLQGQADTSRVIQSFTGSHHYVLDYLLEEVLHRQSDDVQRFLLRTSILDRLCGPLCEAVLCEPALAGQATLATLERGNLFIIPLDAERQWYRYHHLFADLLRQRLAQRHGAAAEGDGLIPELHRRASQWYEEHDFDIDAFRHAAAAQDLDRAERLMDGRGIPLHLRGAVTMLIDWLASLPAAVMQARPRLYWRHAAMLLVAGQTTGVQEKLDAAEAALPPGKPTGETKLLVGRIAAARAVLALTRYQGEVMLRESRRALAHLPAESRSLRANAYWTLGVGHLYLGERAAARSALSEAVTLGQTAGDVFTTLLATIGLGNVQEIEVELHRAAETYRRALQLAGDQPLQIIHEAHLGLARLHYEWNDLDAAERHGHEALHLARQYDQVIDRFILCEIFLARVKLARGDPAGAEKQLAETEQAARQRNFLHRLPEVAAARVLVRLRQGRTDEAAALAQAYPMPIHQARVYLAQGEPTAALAALDAYRQQVEARGWQDERLKVLVIQALALRAAGQPAQALRRLNEALALAEPSGLVRTFVDEAQPMAELLAAAAAQGLAPGYCRRLLAVLEAEAGPRATAVPELVEPLSERELDVLRLIAQGFSNEEIGRRLFLALSTVKGHNQRIFNKLHVQRRTEAVARARELGLL